MSAYLFVYGTLRKGAGHPMHRILSAGAEAAGEATFQGRLFDLGPYPGVVPDPAGRWRVAGEIYRMNRPEPLLSALDEYEGCAPQDPQPHQYRRTVQPIRWGNGEQGEAWIYIYIASLKVARRIESGDYLQWQSTLPETNLPESSVPQSLLSIGNAGCRKC